MSAYNTSISHEHDAALCIPVNLISMPVCLNFEGRLVATSENKHI